jgi:hypothetical protein
VCACFSHGSLSTTHATPSDDAEIRASLVKESLGPLWSGSLVIHRPAISTLPLSAAWEFAVGKNIWHVDLSDDRSQLIPGAAEAIPQQVSYGDFRRWLRPLDMQKRGKVDFRVALQSANGAVDFSAEYRGKGMTDSLQELTSALQVDPNSNAYGFDQVLSAVLRRGLVLTDNRRLPLRRYFTLEELAGPIDLRDGAAIGAELYRLKNGYDNERSRFEEIRATFRRLTGRVLDVRSRLVQQGDSDRKMIIEPTVAGFHGERLVELSGAGIQEALVISVLLHGEVGRVVVLDEPAVNLGPTVQRRLIGSVRGRGQYVLITHSADLVPVEEPRDLDRIVRIAPGRSGSEVHRWQTGGIGQDELFRQLNLMEPTHVRGLLFAAAVILCEGATEVGALSRWWRESSRISLPDPQSANIPVISVDGDGGFGAYIRYLDAFDVPWAIVADGPTLRPTSKLAKQLRRLGRYPNEQPDRQESFARWHEFWENQGVFTLADQFGDDGSKLGEFEAYLQRVDEVLLAQVEADVGKHKPRVGAYFAASHAEPPREVLDLYRKIAAWLRIDTIC